MARGVGLVTQSILQTPGWGFNVGRLGWGPCAPTHGRVTSSPRMAQWGSLSGAGDGPTLGLPWGSDCCAGCSPVWLLPRSALGVRLRGLQSVPWALSGPPEPWKLKPGHMPLAPHSCPDTCPSNPPGTSPHGAPCHPPFPEAVGLVQVFPLLPGLFSEPDAGAENRSVCAYMSPCVCPVGRACALQGCPGGCFLHIRQSVAPTWHLCLFRVPKAQGGSLGSPFLS